MEQDIRIDQIHIDRAYLRSEVTEDSVRALAESIRDHGLLQPIVVRERQGGGWSLIAGRRRLTAAKLLGWITIPARIITTDHPDEIPACVENLQRTQMNPVEEAEAIRVLHEQRGLSINDIARLLHHSNNWVQDRLAILTMPEPFRKAIANRKLSIGAAQQLLQIGDEDYRDYLLSVALVNGATVHQCQAWLLDYQARSKLLNPTGEQGTIPRLPLEAPEPQATCELCAQTLKISRTRLIRTCHQCYDLLTAPPTHQHGGPPLPQDHHAADVSTD